MTLTQTITQPKEIAETFVEYYKEISRNTQRKQETKKNKRKENPDNHPYNEEFTENELKIAMKQQKNTSAGKDTIHPQMIKMLPQETKKYILDIQQNMDGEKITQQLENGNNNPHSKRGKGPKRHKKLQTSSPNQHPK